MRLATWNLNNRVGKVRFRAEAARAAVALSADVLVFTEYFPQKQHEQFCDVLTEAGWTHQLLSLEPAERANRVLIASRLPLERDDDLALPDFDIQFPANMVAARLPTLGLRLLGVRVPAYKGKDRERLTRSWKWLEATAATLRDTPAVIAGDLNVQLPSRKAAGVHFQRILENGWTRAAPAEGHSYFGHTGRRSEIDHLLATARCAVREASYVTAARHFVLAGAPSALSDHAALVADVTVR